MPKTLGYLIFALAGIALVIVLRQTVLEDAEQPDQNEKLAQTLPQSASPFAQTTQISTKPQQAASTRSGTSSASLSALSVDAQAGGASRSEGVPQQNIAEPKTPVARTDASVIGRPFPVSASVQAACEKVTSSSSPLSCAETYELLAKMAEEPRQEPWATSTEQKIRAFAMQEPGKFTIRALECRTTVCFIEAASIYGPLIYPSTSYYLRKESGLRSQMGEMSTETDPYGVKVTVTLWPLTRR